MKAKGGGALEVEVLASAPALVIRQAAVKF